MVRNARQQFASTGRRGGSAVRTGREQFGGHLHDSSFVRLRQAPHISVCSTRAHVLLGAKPKSSLTLSYDDADTYELARNFVKTHR